MTKIQKKRPVRKAPKLGRPSVFMEDFFLISLAATAAGKTQAEFFRDVFRNALRYFLASSGIDPDQAWAKNGSV